MAIYTKLFELATKLKGPNAAPIEEKKEGFLNVIANAVSELFPKKSESLENETSHVHAKPAPPLERPKPNEFYFDKAKGVWVINGKEADQEYDMGQEPNLPSSKYAPVEPPPMSMGGSAKSPSKKNEENNESDSQAEVIKNPFGQPIKTGLVGKKKTIGRSLYVPQ